VALLVGAAARSRILGRPATLDDIPGGEVDHIVARGFDWV
jgi:hypothetical protein